MTLTIFDFNRPKEKAEITGDTYKDLVISMFLAWDIDEGILKSTHSVNNTHDDLVEEGFLEQITRNLLTGIFKYKLTDKSIKLLHNYFGKEQK